ncbi:hypothetical protein [Amycolatopsis sp. NPDC021455]|uniref:hypothetical protein n=1 Tax=Amycolatopsis sp. NPDC021455 TaxID=3154901 RepID=UPI0033DFCA4F
MDAIDALLGGADPEIARLRNYALERVLEVVRASQVDADTVARLEWRLLPALGFEARSPALDRKLATDPAFFVEVITLFMRPRKARDEPSVSEATATNSYRLLNNWKIIPGTSEELGHVDQAKLLSWVVEARRRLVEADRLDVGDQYIGQILARSAVDDDGAWPEKSVREVIESVASSHVEQGLYIGIVNKRGMTARGVMDGGEQERVLAEKYARWVKQVELAWPRTAAVLRAVEQRYRDDAAREDEEVERIRRGLGDE